MPRFKVYLEYDGTRYSGWQVQKNAKTVQGEVMEAMKTVFKSDIADFQGAGRTDAGVHALQQVAHLDVQTMLAPEIIKMKVNEKLPADINILEVEKAPKTFHARHDAIARSYLYQVSCRRTALGKRFVWWMKDELDFDLMRKTSLLFLGMKDMQSFTDDDPKEKSTKILVERIQMHKAGNLILFRVVGSHFVWKLVRRIVGVIVEVGRRKLQLEEVEQMIHSKSDHPARLTAPPSGLFLERVCYNDERVAEELQPVMRI